MGRTLVLSIDLDVLRAGMGGGAVFIFGIRIFGVVIVVVVIFEFDRIVELAGVGGVEYGDGAAAFFIGSFGLVERVDEGAEGIEAGTGEFCGVGGHGGLRKKWQIAN